MPIYIYWGEDEFLIARAVKQQMHLIDSSWFIFNYSQYLTDAIHEQFLKFKIEGAFKHQSILVYLMFLYQEDRCNFQLQKVDENGIPLLVIHWTYLVKRNSK